MNWFLIPLVLAAGCSAFKKSNEKVQGHFQLYSAPEKETSASLARDEKQLVIVATNDLQGKLEATQEVVRDVVSPEKTLISVGGIDVFARYLEILRENFPRQTFVVDAGNSLADTLIARKTKGQAILQAFTKLKYDAISLSAQDLTAGPKLAGIAATGLWLKDALAQSSTPVVLSNLIDLKTSRPVSWGASTPQLLKQINGVQVGLVSLLADDLAGKIGAGVLNGLYVEPTMQSLLRQARSLRLKGADVVVAVLYGGISCGDERATELKLPVDKVNFDPRDPKICDLESSVARFLSELPPGTLDVLVTGGARHKVANVIHGIPVIQAPADGLAFARVDLVWDTKKKALNTEKTRIHQPVRVCHRFFKQTQDCYTEDASVDHRELVPARYLDQPIFPEPGTALWLTEWRQLVALHSEPLLDHEAVTVMDRSVVETLLKLTKAQVAVVAGTEWPLVLPKGSATWRDLLKQGGARENIHLVQIRGDELEALREKPLQNASWASERDLDELVLEDQVTVAMNDSLWQSFSAAQTSTLAPFTVADVLVNWEADAVRVKLSGRRPALPRTQP